jgi:aspartyl protease family protein
VQDLPGWLKHTTVWLLLGVGLFVGVQAWQAQQNAARFTVNGQTLELRRAEDGHYHWPGRIGSAGSMRQIDFLVDTGATGTAIPASLARELGLPVVGTMQSNTAGGVVQGQIVLADLSLQGGVSAEKLRVAALPQLSAPLLGMDVLGKLRWQQERGVMTITAPGAAAP